MVKDMLPATPGPESAEAARSPQMDAAVCYAIAVQEQAGLDLVSDGEWRRHAYTHIIADVEAVSDRVLIIHHGRLLGDGTLAELGQRAGLGDAGLEPIFAHLVSTFGEPA